ncbi:MAG: hypothetical protein AB7U29_04225 [Desulfobulbus sp.]
MFDRSHEVSASSTTSKLPSNCTPLDLQEAFEEELYASRALVELVKTASLSRFDPGELDFTSPSGQIAQDLQYGLSKLIDLCINCQVSLIDSYVEQYKNSDEYLLDEAEIKISNAKAGAYTGSNLLRELKEAESLCETVIGRNGHLVERAENIFSKLLNAELYKCVVPSKKRESQPTPSADQRGEEVTQ